MTEDQEIFTQVAEAIFEHIEELDHEYIDLDEEEEPDVD